MHVVDSVKIHFLNFLFILFLFSFFQNIIIVDMILDDYLTLSYFLNKVKEQNHRKKTLFSL